MNTGNSLPEPGAPICQDPDVLGEGADATEGSEVDILDVARSLFNTVLEDASDENKYDIDPVDLASLASQLAIAERLDDLCRILIQLVPPSVSVVDPNPTQTLIDALLPKT